MKTRNSILAVLLITILVSASATISTHPAYAEANYDKELGVILGEYSNYLKTGETKSPDYFSTDMDNLVSNRRSHYDKFFDVALNSKLLEISSSYATDNSTLISQDSATITVAISEEINFVGKAKTKSVDEYPMIKAAKQASTLAERKLAKDNKKLAAVKKELDAYVASTRNAIDESVKNKYEITNIVRHEFVFSVEEDGLKMIQDSFSDQAKDNLEGTDIVYWENSQFYRIEPDLKASPDYVINNTPVEILAKGLLTDMDGAITTSNIVSIASVSYSRTAAKDYANTWVRNTTYHCSASDSDPFQNNDYYNYTQYIDYGCVDCTNYVSQALKAGGIPTDSTWQAYTTAWINVDSLQQYLVNKGRGYFVSDSSTLGLGDLGMIYSGGWQHVVMVVGLNPLRYSGHTNDRRSVNWSSSLNRYFRMKNTSN
jgi:hypothetical protein